MIFCLRVGFFDFISLNSLFYQRFSKVRQGSLRILGFPIAIHWLVLDFDTRGVADLDSLLSEYPADTTETVLHAFAVEITILPIS